MTSNNDVDIDGHSDVSDESDDVEQHQSNPPQNVKKQRSSRACIACRRMKTRCEFDEALGTACKLCIRARRQCVMQTLPRRRKRKTTERVADLEKKINALTALLANNDGSTAEKTTPDTISDGIKTSNPDDPLSQSPSLITEALDRGFFDWPTACQAFDRYRSDMSHYFPFVVFPAICDANKVKERQPLLFFSIVIVALGTSRGPTNPELWDMLTKELALRIIFRGERSLELVQTLLVHVTWWHRTKEMRELNFNQITHMACTMAVDIGLGRRSHKSMSAQGIEAHELESLAGRRAWLGCYYMATSISMSLRHPNFVRWSVYIEECLDVLSSAPSTLPSDRWLCDLIRIQHIAEDASIVFAMDDPGSVVSFKDVKTQYQIGVFRQQLEQWRRFAHSDLQQAFVRCIEANVMLFVHEVAIHSQHDIDELRSPQRLLSELPLRKAGNHAAAPTDQDLQFVPSRVESLFACLAAIHAYFDAMLAMDLDTLCALPNFFFVRTGYAGRALRKLLFICETQARASGEFLINIEDLKFDEYTSAIVQLFLKTHEENNSPISRAFCLLFSQIKLQGSKTLNSHCPPISGIDEHQDLSSTVTATLAAGSGASSTNGQVNPSSTDLPSTKNTAPINLTSHIVGDQSINHESTVFGQQIMPAVDPGPQMDLPLWLQTDANNTAMSDVDVLQYFDQGFGFDDLEMFNFDDINFLTGGEGLQQ
ncbi:hypothetical protein LTS07_009102 [Exophiala sideris]|uniref:Zn(2)-C6 fungal-type domain-containing protein n=1 Tax=Exophiala sideris TaxID=1016849 RepID=A0ABR0J0K2_9EURO|nr:hypothetical protein LTS07_009102 [Exophiala sideris]KAK5029594.1 hypothetical protein LTR13_008514 [Exophiala sideris]KAK5053383.1 hypothetical protein LTR69_009341 [Exophiala sideris]KAK5179141.1 hypothetical protein LTR44_008295 [Eurotiomycetes sp. CCFEE 6388]